VEGIILLLIVLALSCLPALSSFLRRRRSFTGPMIVTCPETHRAAVIRLDAGRAAATSRHGEPELKVLSCSRWSGPVARCGERCLAEEEALLPDRSSCA
jgi:hypothetical protein